MQGFFQFSAVAYLPHPVVEAEGRCLQLRKDLIDEKDDQDDEEQKNLG